MRPACRPRPRRTLLITPFTGPNLDQLYITTAHCAAEGGNPNMQYQFPDSGHLFKVDFAGRFKGAKRGVFLE